MAISLLARGLRAHGHEVRRLGPARPGRLPGRLLYNARLGSRVERAAPDLAVGFDVDGFLLPRRRGYPLVVGLKGVAADEARFDRGRARLTLRFLSVLERRNARRADRVFVPSAHSARAAARAYGLNEDAIEVVPEAIDPEAWTAPGGAERPTRAAAPPAGEARPPTILSVARQYRRKNTRTLLRALPRVARAVPDVRLRMVGSGPELSSLRRRVRELGIGDRAELLGAVPDHADVREEYLRADCFCLPTLQEGFGIVFLEAMAAGLPIVAGRASAVPEVVPDGGAGLLVDPRDPDELADALIRVLTDPELAARLGRTGRRRARRHTPERVAGHFLEAVADLAPPGASAGVGPRGASTGAREGGRPRAPGTP